MLRKGVSKITSRVVQLCEGVVHTIVSGVHDGLTQRLAPIRADSSNGQSDEPKPRSESEVYTQVSRSVVTIQATFNQHEPDGQPHTQYGTGFFVHSGRHIMTAAHLLRIPPNPATLAVRCESFQTITELLEAILPVVADRVSVTLYDGTTVQTEIVRIDSRADIAVLRVINGMCTPPSALQLEQNESTQVGDRILVIGNAFNADTHSCSVGHVRNPRWKDPRNQNLLSTLLTSAPTSKGVSGAPIVDMQGRVVAIHLGSMEPISPRFLAKIDAEVNAGSDLGTIKRRLNKLLEEGYQIQPPPTTAAMTVGSSDAVASVLDKSFVDQESTMFGGGLLSNFLHTFLQRTVEDQGTVYKAVNARKSVVCFGYVANTPVHRSQLAIVHEKYNHNKGYLVVAVDDTDNPQGLLGHDCVTHVNGRSVGVSADDVSIADLTWFMESGHEIRLTIDRQGEIVRRNHLVGYLPIHLDFCTNRAQAEWWVWLIAAVVLAAVIAVCVFVPGAASVALGVMGGLGAACLHPSTMIQTTQGLRQAHEIKVGDMVAYPGEENFVRVLKTHRKQIKENHQFVRMEYHNGSIAYVSPSHPMPGNISLWDWLQQNKTTNTHVKSFNITVNEGCAYSCDLRTQSETGGYLVHGLFMLSTCNP